jgi:uncharacterized protein
MTKGKPANRSKIDATSTLERVASLDWASISSDLDGHGCAVIGPLLTPEQCEALADSYDANGIFRSRVVMARHGFGRGEYQYFAYPLPPLLGTLRTALYPPLAAIANRWNEAMGLEVRYPREHQAFLDRFLLGTPGADFTGGEFVLTEQRPRLQSRAEVVPLGQGQGVIFPVHHRPVPGTRGTYRVNLRHGVSRLRSGRRHTVGIIFHDAT